MDEFAKNKSLLICTQVMDRKDSTLGFFCRWVELLAEKFGRVNVICLKKGSFDLPSNVFVYSLGKESATGNKFFKKIIFALRFCYHAWRLRKEYDVVFVHMNEEYVLLGGLFWRLLGKKVFMWRNHYEGSFLTDIASIFCNTIFCTSKFSYTSRYKKTILMPVGVDEESYKLNEPIARIPHSVLFLGRISKSKRPELLIKALTEIARQGIKFTATFVGGPVDAEPDYLNQMRALAESLGIANRVVFTGAIPNTETYRYYRSHDIYVNCSPSGMLDKTMFKAVGCGCLTLVSSRDFEELVGPDYIFPDNDLNGLVEKLAKFLTISSEERTRLANALQEPIKRNSLKILIDRLDDLLHQ
ncbi:MAG: glycosyltransferase family 4 protein [Candidatus Terrybacteria bacterium]|nr:glycosyltransferase family 4 protein [Candidatus Terrybacteria bacterium]